MSIMKYTSLYITVVGGGCINIIAIIIASVMIRSRPRGCGFDGLGM